MPALAARLGVSQATLKRRIRDGKPVQIAPGQSVDIEVELLERPQGHEYRVRVKGTMPALSTDQESPVLETPPPISSVQEQSRALDILDAVLRANADTMDRQAERLDRYADLLWQETAKRAAAEERAIATERRADQAERERATAQDALKTAQETGRTIMSALEAVRAERDDLAARLQASAERRRRRWWRIW